MTHIRPLLDFASVAWNTGYLGDLYKLECVLRFWSRNVYGLADLSYAERLKRLNIFSMKGRLLRADLIQIWKIVHGKCPRLEHIIQLSSTRHTRGHKFKLFMPRHNTDIFARSFPMRCIYSWNNLPDYVVSSPTLRRFKYNLLNEISDALFEPCVPPD